MKTSINLSKNVIEFLNKKYEELQKTLFFSSKRLSEEMGISLYETKKQLTILRKQKKVRWEMNYDDTNYCNCINENCNHCECSTPKPFDTVNWYWVFNPKNK